MSKNTIVRGMLVPSLKNKPLDGRQLVPTLGDIVNIENPFVGFIFYVESEGRWYEVVSLTDRIIDELTIPNDMVDEYKEFGKGMTDAEKEEYITKALVEQRYLAKEEAQELYQAKGDYITKQEVVDGYQPKGDYITTEAATEAFQPKGEYVTTEAANEAYQPKGDYATTQKVEELEQLITGGGSGEEGTGGTFVDAPRDGKTYGRKDGLWDELVDAPSDGLAYARINGQWAAIESGNALDPMLPVLSLSIGSSIENDATIAKVVAKVTYADKEFTLGDGGKMNVPYGLSVTVTFPNVENYSTPEAVVFDDVQGSIEASGTYINLQEVVNVYVSADDGSAVDGQMLTVGKLSRRPNGVYIEDKNGKLWSKDEWDGSAVFSSLAIIHNEHSFGVAKDIKQAPLSDLEDAAVGSADFDTLEKATNDFDGVSGTNTLMGLFNVTEGNALYYIKNYKFETNKAAYLPALGELAIARQYGEELEDIFLTLGSEFKISSYLKNARSSSYSNYWNNNQATWAYENGTPSSRKITEYKYNIPFCEITEEQCLYTPDTEEYEVLGGQVSFGALQGDEISIKASAKGDEYRTPDEVHLTVQDGENNVSLVYNLLVIDTIYINNLIADTSSIISGEMNGKAVQAIWNNVHRYLGKIVTKEDGTEELVLLDIDQNDNRYYTDGSMIDLEALGTTAYFFTKIPAMSYKITQMSDNIYKVQISYKHKPEGDGWKYFDELIVPTFAASDDTNRGVPAYFQYCGNRYNPNTNTKYLNGFDLFDYSTMVLLCYAKYGVDNKFDAIDTSEFNENFTKTGSNYAYVYNGYSLANGVKDAKFHLYTYSKDTYAYSILGVENLINYSENLYHYGNITTTSSIGATLRSSNASNSLFDNFQWNVSGNLAIIIYRDQSTKSYDVNYSTGTNYIKSLIVDDYFLSVPKSVGATDGTYYKSKQYAGTSPTISTGYLIMRGMLDMYLYYTSSSYPVRVKVVCPHRIEEDRDAFEALTNIWVS